ncbi:uncharacterized protein LOC112478328 [Pteropus alecto]|uniref:uncharacterized protein LOC112478328 n=1 Tax=Pteropus alecto TaxID=9402 RepID=UPI000D5353D2|nr:uncharacterized protein LOC112478328 [Pteropus alecto]
MALEPWREQLPSTQSPWPSGHERHWGARPPCTDRMRKNEAVDGWLSERPGSELFGDRGSGKLRLAASLSSDLAAAWLCADGSSEPVASDSSMPGGGIAGPHGTAAPSPARTRSETRSGRRKPRRVPEPACAMAFPAQSHPSQSRSLKHRMTTQSRATPEDPRCDPTGSSQHPHEGKVLHNLERPLELCCPMHGGHTWLLSRRTAERT